MKSNKFFFWLKTVLFCGLILSCCVIGFIMPLRPEISDLESRELTKFPEFNMEDFLSGEYTSKINLWYSDTFPGRDWLVQRNGDLKNLYGIKTIAFQGGNAEKDEINTNETFIWDFMDTEATKAPETTSETEAETVIEHGTDTSTGSNSHEETEDKTELASNTEEATENDSDNLLEITTEVIVDINTEEITSPDETPDNTPSEDPNKDPIVNEAINGYYVSGNRGYQLYYFSKENASRYAKSIMNTAIKLNGTAQVYSMIAPISAVIYLPEDEMDALGVSNGKDGMEYIYRMINSYSDQLVAAGQLSSPVKTLNLYDCLIAHKDEYIYYRTDHHWTGLGAYYASRFFLDSVGKSYPSLDQYKEVKLDGFLGTLYKHTQNANLKNNPDTVYAYESPTVNSCKILYKGSDEYVEKPIINSNVTSSNKYLCFITGDRPHTIIHNETINDGSSIVIIKDSFGNSFAPMIADSYEYVHVIDYRHWDGDIVKFVEENGIDTVLFLLNIMATASDTSMTNLENFLK